MTPLRVLVLTSTFPRWKGDTEPPFVYELSRRLAQRHEVVVLAPHARGAARRERMDGVEVIRFRYAPEVLESLAYDGGIPSKLRRRRSNFLLVPPFVIGEWLATNALMRQCRFDVLHAHWLVPQGVVAAVAALRHGNETAVVATSHGGDLYGLKGALALRLKRYALVRSDCVTIVSRAMKDSVTALGASPEKVHVISMGVDAQNTFLPDPVFKREDRELLFVGRLVEKKGVACLLRALPEILAGVPGVRLTIIGAGPEESALDRLARDQGISQYVAFLGAVRNEELPPYYRRATLFVGPSVVAAGGDQEGLGLVFAEALACECPVVASNLPAIRDVVLDGRTGLLARPADPNDLAAKVIALLTERERRATLAREGRRHVLDCFDWAAVASRYSDLLAEAAQRKQRAV